MDEILKSTIQMKAVEQYFAGERAVFMWYKLVLAFASVVIILQCGYSSKSC